MSDEFRWVAIAIVTIISSARITRLVTWDTFPPSVWLRIKWDTITRDGSWSILAHCGYCFGLYAAGFTVLTGWLSDWHLAWWLFNGWLAAGYAAAVVMAFDGDDGDDD